MADTDMNLLPEPESASLDLAAMNAEALKALFPEAFTEDGLDLEVLGELIGEPIAQGEERYGLNWAGKREARRAALTPSTGTLRPMIEESVDWDTTRNIFIEGDNLEVLKLLQKSYYGKVKMIYIDPPYNTGGDFIYPDNFSDTIGNYLKLTGQVDDEGVRLTANAETSGRYHTNWLNMMYPRLKLARNLLREDGVIFISIDDHEVGNLRLMCDEVFGGENFVATVIWQRAYSPVNLKKTFSPNHDYILCYAKSIGTVDIKGLARTEAADARYQNPDNDPRGPWQSADLSVGPAVAERIYEIVTPAGRSVLPPSGYCWRLSRSRYEEYLADSRIWFGADGTGVPRIKRFRSEVKDRMTPMTIWLREEVGDSQEATRELKALFEGRAVMDYPKPVRLISRLIELTCSDGELVVDFFAGSGTTGQACMAVAEAGGALARYILVQLPEDVDSHSEAANAGCQTISKLGVERLRRAGAEVRRSLTGVSVDTGVQVYSLDRSNIAGWDPHPHDIQVSLLETVCSIDQARTSGDVVTELLLRLGLDLASPVEWLDMGDAEVASVSGGALVVVHDGVANHDTARIIVETIGPEVIERIVALDRCFASDADKANFVQALRQAGIDDVRGL